MANPIILSVPHTVRFPRDLYDKIHALADSNGRTFNGQVVYLLQLGYTIEKKYEEGIKEQVETAKNDGQ